jgi:hypothetical protein
VASAEAAKVEAILLLGKKSGLGPIVFSTKLAAEYREKVETYFIWIFLK